MDHNTKETFSISGESLLKKLRAENAPLERPGNRELEALPPATVHLAAALFGQTVLIGALAPLASLMQSATEAYGNPDAHYNEVESGGSSG